MRCRWPLHRSPSPPPRPHTVHPRASSVSGAAPRAAPVQRSSWREQATGGASYHCSTTVVPLLCTAAREVNRRTSDDGRSVVLLEARLPGLIVGARVLDLVRVRVRVRVGVRVGVGVRGRVRVRAVPASSTWLGLGLELGLGLGLGVGVGLGLCPRPRRVSPVVESCRVLIESCRVLIVPQEARRRH